MSPESNESLPVLRAAFETSGSGAWLMRTITGFGLDHANNFRLELMLGDDRMRGDRQATEARLIAGEVDLIDTDWLSVAKHRRAGLPLAAAVPYGAIFGALVAPADGDLKRLDDLPGKCIGVVREHDKNWLLLRAACRERGIGPIDDCALRVCGSKSLLRDRLESGAVDGALLYWHQVPAMIAGGRFTEVCDLLDLLPADGGRRLPSSFFVFDESQLAERAATVRGFSRAVHAAVRLLREDETLWRRISGADQAFADGLRARWLARVGLTWSPEMTGVLGRLAARLDTRNATLPAGTFAAGFLH